MGSIKNGKWIPLDVDALDDPKIMDLVSALGMEGYGTYIMLIQHIAKQEPEYTLPLTQLKHLAYRNHLSEEKVFAVVNRFNLFVVEENIFYSLSLLKRMERYDNLKKINRDKANLRWSKHNKLNQGNAVALPEHCHSNADKNRIDKNRIDKNRIDKKKNKKDISLTLTFCSDSFLPVWEKWLAYRKEIKKPYSTETGMKTKYKELVDLSGEDPATALLIINQSIGNEWTGLFELKKNSGSRKETTHGISKKTRDYTKPEPFK